jgi:glycosyltransferase involved in cell wall biosynthesis
VICPKGPGDPSRQEIDGIHIYKYSPAPEASGLVGFVIEFVYCWLRTAWLSLVVWQRRPFGVIQACNPPDTYWVLARLWRSRGVKFVFDQHDLNPELFISRFGEPKTLLGRLELAGLRWLERMTYRTADKIISTNESYRAIALHRGKQAPEDITVVRSGPDTRQMRPVYPDKARSAGTYSLVYLGVMGPQDGVDLILRVMADLIHRRGRRDISATLLGFGDCLENLRLETTRLNLDEWVSFTGRADKAMIADHLSSADIGLSPDPKTPLNDVSTMNKTMEYMAYALPSVAFDLIETKVSGGNSVLYVPSGDEIAFADAVERLLANPELRADMAVRARHRVVETLDWLPQSRRYVSVFKTLIGSPSLGVLLRRHQSQIEHQPEVDRHDVDHRGRSYVDLDDVTELRRFILERSSCEREPQY